MPSGVRRNFVRSSIRPLALRPVISGGLLIIISGWAAIASPAPNRRIRLTLPCKPSGGEPPLRLFCSYLRRRRVRSLALRPAVSSGLPFIISGQADIAVQTLNIRQDLNAVVPVALCPGVSPGLPKIMLWMCWLRSRGVSLPCPAAVPGRQEAGPAVLFPPVLCLPGGTPFYLRMMRGAGRFALTGAAARGYGDVPAGQPGSRRSSRQLEERRTLPYSRIFII